MFAQPFLDARLHAGAGVPGTKPLATWPVPGGSAGATEQMPPARGGATCSARPCAGHRFISENGTDLVLAVIRCPKLWILIPAGSRGRQDERGNKGPEAPTAEKPQLREISDEKLEQILEEHGKWVESEGKEGERAELRRANLRQREFRRANLRQREFRRANLQGADLFGANLQRANFSGGILDGAHLGGTLV